MHGHHRELHVLTPAFPTLRASDLPAGTFDYNISVPNRGECTITDLVVTDTITGPAGFEVVGTEPDATVSGGTVTFNIGDLAPNQTVNLTITDRKSPSLNSSH